MEEKEHSACESISCNWTILKIFFNTTTNTLIRPQQFHYLSFSGGPLDMSEEN